MLNKGYALVKRVTREEVRYVLLIGPDFAAIYPDMKNIVETLNQHEIPRDKITCSEDMKSELEGILKDNLDK